MLLHRPSCFLRPTVLLAVSACLLVGLTWPDIAAAQDVNANVQICQDTYLKELEGEVADLARLVGDALVVLDRNMDDLSSKPSELFERSQAYWLKSREAACASESDAQVDTCLCETGLARHADLTKLHQTLQTAVATAQESER